MNDRRKIWNRMFVLGLAFSALALVPFLGGCGLDNEGQDADPYAIQDSIRAFLTDSLVDTLTKYGMVINKGDNPPDVEGFFHANSLKRIGTNLPGDNIDTFHNISMKFYDQTEKQRISLEYQGGSMNGGGAGTFITGTGKRFTIFIHSKGVSNQVQYESAECYSGWVDGNGIHDMVMGLFVTRKGADPSDKVLDVGYGRVIKESDGLMHKVADFPHKEAGLDKAAADGVERAGSAFSR